MKLCYKPIEIKIPIGNKERYRLVPCRQCLECRQVRAKEWALRCMSESKSYKQSCFITLTYAKSPYHLVKKDLQDFLKRLRKHISPTKIRYFSCGEYGEQRLRPHFHILIYGYDFPDKYKESQSKRGYVIYNSETLERIWGHGMVTIQELTLNSAAYCALYSSKHKSTLPPHLRKYPEFNTMSQGLGIANLLKDFDKYILTDEIFLDGIKHNIPQAVLNKKFSEFDRKVVPKKQYADLKARRIEKAQANENSRWVELGGACLYSEKKYYKENAIKRLTKKI